MATNPINPLSDDVTQPARNAVAITPSDTTDLTIATRGIYIGGAGNVAVIMAGGQTVTFTALATGIVHPLSVARVKSTGTTATTIIGVY